MTDVVNLAEKLAAFDELWSPKVVAELNGQELRLVKLRGEFVWHRHEVEDELFLALEGSMRVHLRDRTVSLAPGELFVVPHGVEHKTSADELASCLVITSRTTRTTGGVADERARDPEDLERL